MGSLIVDDAIAISWCGCWTATRREAPSVRASGTHLPIPTDICAWQAYLTTEPGWTHAEVIGTRGSLVIGRPPRINRVEIYDEGGVRTECLRNFYDRFEEAFLLEAEEFVDCILEGNPPRVSLHDAAEATRIGIAATKSYRSGELVRL